MPGHDWLYAIGDVNGRALLTHMGKYQARIAADVILGRDARLDERAGGPLSPRVVFTDPQVAAVGHTLASAQEAGIDARAVDTETSGTAGGSFYGRNAPGTSRLVVDERAARARRRDVRRRRRLRVRPRRDDRDRRRGDRSTASGTRRRRFPTRSEIWLRLLEAYGL